MMQISGSKNLPIRGWSFFFSSRRRHTRFDCDWSSDVCSSDLVIRAVSCRMQKRFLGHGRVDDRSEEHTSELQSQSNLVCRLLLEKKKKHKQKESDKAEATDTCAGSRTSRWW